MVSVLRESSIASCEDTDARAGDFCQVDKVTFKLKQVMHDVCPQELKLFRLGGSNEKGKSV